jgi:adenine/guanine phosphoribosyltransferase-like PRPP-binding protein
MDVVTERPQTRPPYHAYAAIMGVYAGGLALAAAAARLLGREPRDPYS